MVRVAIVKWSSPIERVRLAAKIWLFKLRLRPFEPEVIYIKKPLLSGLVLYE